MSLVLLRTSPNELICRAITHNRIAPTYVSRVVANVLIYADRSGQVRSVQYSTDADAKRGFMTIETPAAVRCK